MNGSTASFGSIYGAPRSGGVASAPIQQTVNATPSRQSTGVSNLLALTGSEVSTITGLELPTLLALGALAVLLIYLD